MNRELFEEELGSAVNGPLTPAHSLREMGLKAYRVLLPLPQGEGWGEGTNHRKPQPPAPDTPHSLHNNHHFAGNGSLR